MWPQLGFQLRNYDDFQVLQIYDELRLFDHCSLGRR